MRVTRYLIQISGYLDGIRWQLIPLFCWFLGHKIIERRIRTPALFILCQLFKPPEWSIIT